MPASDVSQGRLLEIIETIQALARLEFGTTAPVGAEGNVFDALAAGVNMLGEELAEYKRQVDERAAALARANAELTRLAHHDPLTGLANRRQFRGRLTQALGDAADSGLSVAVLMVDLDGFKEVNDSLGHEVGDQMLTEVAARLDGATVGSSILAARFGGDEFCLLAVGASEAAAVTLAEEVAARLREPFFIVGQPLRISASVGIAVARPGETPDEIMRNADVALYASKTARLGTPQVYVQGMVDPIVQRLRLSSALRGAVEGGRISIAYQPIVELATRSIVGFEALARWSDRELGDVPPSVFIPLAEQIGVMSQLGDRVLKGACAEASTWHVRGREMQPYVSVNLSAVQLQDPALPDRIADVLRRARLPAGYLMLEVTESQLVQHLTDAVEVLGELRDRGIHIALDDFGTGYSSLSYLHRLPVDVVKIDRAFVAGIGTDPGQWAFAQAVVRLIHRLGRAAVAEGVEDAVQLAHARATGCELAQGYYFGRPGDAASARALLAAQDLAAGAGDQADAALRRRVASRDPSRPLGAPPPSDRVPVTRPATDDPRAPRPIAPRAPR